jgi:hypothetical protein
MGRFRGRALAGALFGLRHELRSGGTSAPALRLTGWMRFPTLELKAFRPAAAFVAVLLATVVGAAGAGFSDQLSPTERAATGIANLTATQIGSLDSLVARDVTYAHEGGVTGFSSTFTERCTTQERASIGIDRLSEQNRSRLDFLIARAISAGPPPEQAFAYSPPAKSTPPAPVTLVSQPPHLEVHGDVSLTVGAGSHGSNFYGTSADLFVTDPTGKYTIGVGYSQYHGKGYFPLCDPLLFGPPL